MSNLVLAQKEISSRAPFESNECAICGVVENEWAYSISRGEVHRCTGCGVHIVRDLTATPETQESLFYSTIDEKKYKAYFESFRKGQVRHVLSTLGLAPDATLLDVGASYGWTVEVGREMGLDAYGIEPGDAAYRPELQGRMFRGTLADYTSNSGKERWPEQFDVLNLWHVLEHLQNPVETIEQMRSLTKPGGTVIIAVPTTDGFMFRLGMALYRLCGWRGLLDELYYCHNPNMHFYYYNIPSLERLMDVGGLQLVRSFLLESFDWRNFYKRISPGLLQKLVWMGGPFLHFSRFTARENLILVCKRV